MRCIDRFKKYREDDFDRVMLLIKNGTIKCGKYAHHVKIDENKSFKGRKEFFNNGKDKSE